MTTVDCCSVALYIDLSLTDKSTLSVCVIQIAKMDLHQQQQQQQLVTSNEAINSSYTRVVIIKFINVTLAMLAVFLILISTASHLASRLTATRYTAT